MSFKTFVESRGFRPDEYNMNRDPVTGFMLFISKDLKKIPEFKDPENSQRLVNFIKSVKDLLFTLSPVEGKQVRALVITHHFCERILQREVDDQDVLHAIRDYYSKNAEEAMNMKGKEREGVISLPKQRGMDTNVVFAYNTNGTAGVIEDDTLKLVTTMDKDKFVPSNKDDIVHVSAPRKQEIQPKKNIDLSRFQRVK
jgi:hypothetical protein